MKRSILLIALSLGVLVSQAQFEKATLQATGLTCAMCSNAINKALQAVPFVSSVKSDIKNSSFDIVFREHSDVDIDRIRKAVEDAGFAVGSLSVTGNFQSLTVEKDQHITIGGRQYHFVNINGEVLNGERTLKVVDKDFLTAKQFRKFTSATHLNCLNTGKAGDCCTGKGMEPGTRVYHVTI